MSGKKIEREKKLNDEKRKRKERGSKGKASYGGDGVCDEFRIRKAKKNHKKVNGFVCIITTLEKKHDLYLLLTHGWT